MHVSINLHVIQLPAVTVAPRQQQVCIVISRA